MKKPHPHADVIKKWADGAQAQYYALGEWHDMVDEPIWYRDTQFRIKPEPKPDNVYELRTYEHTLSNKKNGWIIPHFAWPTDVAPATLRLVYDGETGKLKSAEVL